MRKIITLIFSILIFCSSCRFSVPLIKFSKEITQSNEYDSGLKESETIEYRYFRISRYGIFGGCTLYKDYNEKGELIKLFIEKQKASNLFDGTQKTKEKTIYYENKKKCRVDYKIIQAFGIGGKCILDKTVIYNKDGTKTKTINKKEKNPVRKIRKMWK
jgi:hypothetical protein